MTNGHGTLEVKVIDTFDDAVEGLLYTIMQFGDALVMFWKE